MLLCQNKLSQNKVKVLLISILCNFISNVYPHFLNSFFERCFLYGVWGVRFQFISIKTIIFQRYIHFSAYLCGELFVFIFFYIRKWAKNIPKTYQNIQPYIQANISIGFIEENQVNLGRRVRRSVMPVQL